MLHQQYNISYGCDRLFALLGRAGMLIRQRHRKPRTIWLGHIFPIYSNLVKDMTPTRPNEVWVSDITYVKVDDGFLYLFLMTDMYSRKIVGWELAGDMLADNAVKVLQQAIEQKGESDLPTIHHSDKGTQYCCGIYVAILRRAQIAISMTEESDPRENAYAERINGTIKNEFLKRLHPTKETVHRLVANAIHAYNHLRPHSSIEYLTPAVAHTRTGKLKRLWKTYPWYSKKNSEKRAKFAPQPTEGDASVIRVIP